MAYCDRTLNPSCAPMGIESEINHAEVKATESTVAVRSGELAFAAIQWMRTAPVVLHSRFPREASISRNLRKSLI